MRSATLAEIDIPEARIRFVFKWQKWSSAAELSRQARVGRASVSGWLNGKTRKLNPEVLQRLSEKTGPDQALYGLPLAPALQGQETVLFQYTHTQASED